MFRLRRFSSVGARYQRTMCSSFVLLLCLKAAHSSAATGTESPPVLSFGSAHPASVATLETAPVFNIDQLVTFVLNNSATLEAGKRSVQRAAAGVQTASALPNPKIEFENGRSVTGIASADGSIGATGISQLIENPWMKSARIDAATRNEKASAQGLRQLRNELVAQVRVHAYEYLLRKEEAKAAADALTLLEQIRERVKLRVSTGEAGKYELIKADAEIITARQREHTARLQIAQAAISINRLASGRLPAAWKLNAQFSENIALQPLASLKETALRDNPELRMLEADLERNQSRVREVSTSLVPGIELRVKQSREPSLQQNMIGLSVQIPLFDQLKGPKAEAIAEQERSQIRLEGRRAELMQQLELAWNAVDIARVRIKALSEGAMRDAEAALRIAEAAYQFGERGILEVLDAQRMLRAVRQDLLMARYQFQASLAELEALSGRYADWRE